MNEFLTISMTLIALILTFKELILNKDKFRYDLYDRRFSVYSDAINYFHTIVVYNPSSESTENLYNVRIKFLNSLHESRFLFDKKSGIYELLSEMHTRSFERTGFKEIAPDLMKGGSDPKIILDGYKKCEEVLPWFSKSLEELTQKMKPYLDFHNINKNFKIY